MKQYVVQLSETTDLYLLNDVATWDGSTWGGIGGAIVFDTLEEAEQRAVSIGHGTVGTRKPS